MNLAAPFVPQHSALFGDHAIDATGGQQAEGGQYLGSGLLVLFLLGAILVVTGRAAHPDAQPLGPDRRDRCHGLVRAVRRHVYIGHFLLLQIDHVPSFVQQFRATGRFFWPASYLIMLTSVVVVARSLRPIPATAVLLAATALQFIDTSGLRRADWLAPRAEPAWAIDTQALAPILAGP